MTVKGERCVYYVLGFIALPKGRGLCGSACKIEEAISSAAERFDLNADDQAQLRETFNVAPAKAGGK